MYNNKVKENNNQSEIVSALIPISDIRKLQEISESIDRSLSYVIRKIISKYLEYLSDLDNEKNKSKKNNKKVSTPKKDVDTEDDGYLKGNYLDEDKFNKKTLEIMKDIEELDRKFYKFKPPIHKFFK